MKKSRAFTLIELLVVVAIIALLISILLPSLSRARELSKRTMCAANEKGLGQAFYIYAQDDPNVFPAWSSTTGAGSPGNIEEGAMALFWSMDRSIMPATTGTPSPSVDMWTVVKTNNTTPKQYICPSTSDNQDPAQDPTIYYDFNDITRVSYAYQYQHSPNRRVLSTSSEPNFPVLADANPYIKGALALEPEPAFAQPLDDRTLAPPTGGGNSTNHSNREGQNVLFQDSHVAFEKGPDVGPAGNINTTVVSSRWRDNAYTTHVKDSQEVDPGENFPTVSWQKTSGVNDQRTNTGSCVLGDKSDACLVP